ncbi:hypothetical protein FBUS_09746 [Fasciolopsis buskii]|uniref:Elongator complex protein 5 n=1 Tax=Fasciolopsis buskii TaxID=27845 RepID=A0A8E0RU17_9TREM|nr:hypothetical protein FBUS_09746 [Fasciolopsis buski]
MLFQCPKETEFEFWIRRLLGIICETSCSESVGRVTVAYRPVRNRDGAFIAGSDTVLSSLDQCVTTLIKIQSPFLPTDLSFSTSKQKHIRICQISFWHSRARQVDFTPVSLTASAQKKSKPALHEVFTVHINTTDWTFDQFLEVSKSDSTSFPTQQNSQPESTFALTMTASEMISRSQVVLPFNAPSIKTDPTMLPQSPGMTIHYQPDCFDDFDDDDPDDDLEI